MAYMLTKVSKTTTCVCCTRLSLAYCFTVIISAALPLRPTVFVFAILETFILLSVLINSLLLCTTGLYCISCLSIFIVKCSFAVFKVVIKES